LNTELQRLIKYYKDDTVEVPTKLSELYGEEYREQWTKEKINYVMQNMELVGEDEQFLQI
jgi:hypothetical protein